MAATRTEARRCGGRRYNTASATEVRLLLRPRSNFFYHIFVAVSPVREDMGASRINLGNPLALTGLICKTQDIVRRMARMVGTQVLWVRVPARHKPKLFNHVRNTYSNGVAHPLLRVGRRTFRCHSRDNHHRDAFPRVTKQHKGVTELETPNRTKAAVQGTYPSRYGSRIAVSGTYHANWGAHFVTPLLQTVI